MTDDELTQAIGHARTQPEQVLTDLLAERVGRMGDGQLIVFNNGTLSDTPEREAALAEIHKRGLSHNGFYTAEAQRLAREYVSR